MRGISKMDEALVAGRELIPDFDFDDYLRDLANRDKKYINSNTIDNIPLELVVLEPVEGTKKYSVYFQVLGSGSVDIGLKAYAAGCQFGEMKRQPVAIFLVGAFDYPSSVPSETEEVLVIHGATMDCRLNAGSMKINRDENGVIRLEKPVFHFCDPTKALLFPNKYKATLRSLKRFYDGYFLLSGLLSPDEKERSKATKWLVENFSPLTSLN